FSCGLADRPLPRSPVGCRRGLACLLFSCQASLHVLHSFPTRRSSDLNFLAQVEVDHFDVTRVQMGINPFDFNWLLENGESFQTPEVVMVYSDEGLNGMSQTYHTLYRTRLAK